MGILSGIGKVVGAVVPGTSGVINALDKVDISGKILGDYDVIPGFDPFTNRVTPTSGTAPTAGGGDAGGGGGGSGSYYQGATGGGGAAAAQAAAERSAAIAQLQRILGNISGQRDQGIQRLDQAYGTSSQRLNEDRERAMLGYGEQDKQNEGEKLRGTEQVDSFANKSYSNLQRLLQGAGAGNSSVARELVPQLVSKSAGTRRQGVFDTFADNQGTIDLARNDAITQFDRSRDDLELQRNQQKESFLRNILESEQDIYGQLAGLQSGGNAAAARAAADARNASLNSLFSQFNPQLSAKAVNLQTPDIAKYAVDQAAAARGGGSLPTETSYYLPALKKKMAQQ